MDPQEEPEAIELSQDELEQVTGGTKAPAVSGLKLNTELDVVPYFNPKEIGIDTK